MVSPACNPSIKRQSQNSQANQSYMGRPWFGGVAVGLVWRFFFYCFVVVSSALPGGGCHSLQLACVPVGFVLCLFDDSVSAQAKHPLSKYLRPKVLN